MRRIVQSTLFASTLALLFSCTKLPPAGAADPPATAPAANAEGGGKLGKLPHVTFDAQKKQVRVECEALAVNAPLEFFVCKAGTSEHEAVLRTAALPSHIHAALLAIGLKPGAPISYIAATEKIIPPHGPPLHATVEFQKDGKTVSYPAYRWIRDQKTKKEPKAFSWVFCGSRLSPEGRYVADDTGYVVTVVNFDYALIDIPEIASSSNETLEWERNAELMPPKGTTVWLVLEPVGKADAPATRPAEQGGGTGSNAPAGVGPGIPPPIEALLPGFAAPTTAGTTAPANVATPAAPEGTDEARMQAMIREHDKILAPRAQALREAAQTHYEVISSLRKEQQRLISEADLIQRTIDELEKKWADLTLPRPADEPAAPQ